MPRMQTAKRQMVRAREAVVVTVGARAPVYEKRIVRDRRTGKLVEVEMNPELPPIDPGSEGIPYVFRRDETVDADHPAVIASPGSFVPVEDD